jgi:hypothetical protein
VYTFTLFFHCHSFAFSANLDALSMASQAGHVNNQHRLYVQEQSEPKSFIPSKRAIEDEDSEDDDSGNRLPLQSSSTSTRDYQGKYRSESVAS